MSTDADLAPKLGREIVSEIAPDELAMFDFFVRRFDDSGVPDGAFLVREEHQAGSGLAGSEVIISYIVLAILQPIGKALAEGALEAFKETGHATVKAILKPYAAELQARLNALLPAKCKDQKVTALKSYLDELGPAK
jgi:hypothetical protein